jgi:pyruvate/2-oxoacid:ferredoxin oxidoreductase alpha subunit
MEGVVGGKNPGVEALKDVLSGPIVWDIPENPPLDAPAIAVSAAVPATVAVTTMGAVSAAGPVVAIDPKTRILEAVASNPDSSDSRQAATGKGRRRRLTDEQREARLQQQLAILRERRTKKSKRERDRQLIVLGGTALAEMRQNAAFREAFAEVIRTRVVRPFDKEAVSEWLSPTSMQE